MTRRRPGGPLRVVEVPPASEPPVLRILASFVAVGDGLKAEDIRDWLAKHGQVDPEVAHAVVDELLMAALRSIRDGHDDPAGLARAVLMVADADFPRWQA